MVAGGLEVKLTAMGHTSSTAIRARSVRGSELLLFLSLGRGAYPASPFQWCAPRSAPEQPDSRPRSLWWAGGAA
jgi:hypothetical protein